MGLARKKLAAHCREHGVKNYRELIGEKYEDF